MFTGTGLVAFGCIFGSGIAGLLAGRLLPDAHRDEPTHKAVHTIMSVVGLLAALVLGLLVASVKSSFDTSSKEIEQFSTSLILLDREAANLGSEAKPVRDLVRSFTQEKIAQIWAADPERVDHARSIRLLDDIQSRLRGWTPPTEAEREARIAALRAVDDIKLNSRLLAVQQSRHVSHAFLLIVVFWISALFFSYGAFAPCNASVVAALFVAAFSVAAAFNLIVDMDHPFAGFVSVSKVPMQQALDSMAP